MNLYIELFVYAVSTIALIIYCGRKYQKSLNVIKNFNLILHKKNQWVNAINKWFSSFYKLLKILIPLIWPSDSFLLQVQIGICFLTVVLGCIVNIYVPLYSQMIIDSLSFRTPTFNNSQSFHSTGNDGINYTEKQHEYPWDLILIFTVLNIIQGFGQISLLHCVQKYVWTNLEHHSIREIQVKYFEHVHNLGMRWQTNRKTGDLLISLERGTAGASFILEHFIFSIFPTIFDIIIAIIYLSTKFNSFWFGFLVFVQVVIYLFSTYAITEWRANYQNTLNHSENQQKQQALESLLNFETVKYYANEAYERDKYALSISKFQKQQLKVNLSLYLMQLMQLLITNLGLLVGSIYIVWMIINDGSLSVGDYVLFSSYLGQLNRPLNYLGTNYRLLRYSFIDLESMFLIFQTVSDVPESPDAPALKIKEGSIEFRNVSFHYDAKKEIFRDLSFSVPAKKTVALVGNSGSGKTSILRLLLRFYDTNSGDIFIDGESIKTVSQKSLRRAIGVVPQETILFNQSISENIKYGKLEAKDDEVVAASTEACVHDKICTFPEGYATKVGERGIKLSGGEKQRVSIARTILKNPAILLLDEATSALDIHTEREIQSSFQKLCQNRTCIVVTHRLFTIFHADEILVLKDGRICERGTHAYLIQKRGEYASMWAEQNKRSGNKA